MKHDSPADGNSNNLASGDANKNNPEYAFGYFLNTNQFVSVLSHIGPWSRSDAPTITIKVTPQPAGSMVDGNAGQANDLNIFVANGADINNYQGPASPGFLFNGIRK